MSGPGEMPVPARCATPHRSARSGRDRYPHRGHCSGASSCSRSVMRLTSSCRSIARARARAISGPGAAFITTISCISAAWKAGPIGCERHAHKGPTISGSPCTSDDDFDGHVVEIIHQQGGVPLLPTDRSDAGGTGHDRDRLEDAEAIEEQAQLAQPLGIATDQGNPRAARSIGHLSPSVQNSGYRADLAYQADSHYVAVAQDSGTPQSRGPSPHSTIMVAHGAPIRERSRERHHQRRGRGRRRSR